MRSPIRRRLWTSLVLVAAGVASYLWQGTRTGQAEVGYMPPRYPAFLTKKPTEEEKRILIHKAVRQTGGWTRLGLAKPGETVLIVGGDKQDKGLIEALITALKSERGVEARYLPTSQMIKEALNMSEEEQQKILTGSNLYGIGQGVKDGWREGFRWPRFLPAALRDQLSKEARLSIKAMEEGGHLERFAMKEYLRTHPEYSALFGGSGDRQIDFEIEVGPKWRSKFEYANWESLRRRNPNFPGDIWHLVEDKVLGLLPWIEEVRITDPQGTDLRFKVTPSEAAMWAKAAYLPNHIFMYPLQGTRDLYWREGIKGHIVPDTNGLVAATSNHSGNFPAIKVHVKHGLVERVEGGGRYGELWRKVLENEEVRTAQYPYMPHPGLFYLFEVSLGIITKGVKDYHSGAPDTGRSGLFHWGFGIESTTPEITKFAEQRHLPNDHGFHLQTYFTTYEVRMRGSDKWIKITDGGHLAALDDMEVRALASRYSDSDKLLREDWVPAMPGVNVRGDYWKDFASDPVAHFTREMKEIDEGTYKYLQ